MPILSGDIKLMASERLTDNPDGGGRITGNEITDGASNNLFPDVSDLDRVYGRVSLRKTFVYVDTDNTPVYFGAHLITQDPPDDPKVSVALFTTDSHVDERTNARSHIESYVVKGAVSRMRLLEDQLEGQLVIIAYQLVGAELPDIGDVLCLVTETGTHAGEEQFVRVISRSAQTQTFVDSNGAFQRDVVTIEIGNPLRYRFYGQPAVRTTGGQPDTLVRTTNVADAARYYATNPLAVAANTGDLTVQAESIFGALVPSATGETPLVDVNAAEDTFVLIATGPERTVNVSTMQPWNGPLHLPTAAYPGSITIVGGADYSETGDGKLLNGLGVEVGTVDYADGIITPDASQANTGLAITYTPAVAVAGATNSASRAIVFANRGLNYTATLFPAPAPGVLTFDYMSQGKWYRLRDNGAGELSGDKDGIGTGTINYSTGSIIVTLGALPDVDTAIIWTWGGIDEYETLTGQAAIDPTVVIDLANEAVPGSQVITWTVDSVGKTATVDTQGVISGDATGSAYGDTIRLVPNELPAPATVFTVDYDAGVSQAESFAGQTGSVWTFTLTHEPVEPGALKLLIDADVAVALSQTDINDGWVLADDTPNDTVLTITDDGAGNLVGDCKPGGTINYTTGAISVEPYKQWTGSRFATKDSGWVWEVYQEIYGDQEDFRDVTYTATGKDAAGAIDSTYIEAASGIADQATAALTELTINLNESTIQTIVGDSVIVTIGSDVYVDRAGTAIRNPDPVTGAGEDAGTVDYVNGRMIVTAWTSGVAANASIDAQLLTIGERATRRIVFRLPGAPVRPGSFFVRAVSLDGTQFDGTADINGDITGTGIQNGFVDTEIGVVDVQFSDYVDPSSIFFNCVVLTYLPLDAELLGLDPVRLPSTGRVPIFRPGDVAVIHHTDTTVFPDPVTAGQVINLGRTRLSFLEIKDAVGAVLDAAQFTADLDAGTVTMANPLDVSGYTQPFTASHRIEDMSLVTDVQINGYVTFMQPVSHDYPLGSRLSSALIAGDMQARVTNVFDQETWTGVFSDVLIGDEPTAEFNATTYPLVVTNRGAITERWALIFTGSTTFKVVGESVGEIAIGDVTSSLAPVNPNNGSPYFTLDPLGWGSGWSVGNVLRFNTIGATFPVWIARTILQGDATGDSDSFRIQTRGNANQ